MSNENGEKKSPIKVGTVSSHFLDSGAFSLRPKAKEYAKKNQCSEWDYYDTNDFWSYVNSYAKFVKKYRIAIDLFANVDVIPNPKLTWRNQKYLEKKHNLRPVPVVHYRTDLKWLRFYMEKGYEIIGLGGLVGNASQDYCQEWLDRAFEIVCDAPDRFPKVKIHGFGVTSYSLMLRYPWFSVDSSTWTKVGAFGGILVPHQRKGKFIFTEQPYMMKVSDDSPDAKIKGRHFTTLSKMEQKIIREWLDFINIPLGKTSKDGKIMETGVINGHVERRTANLLFFEEMRKSLPEYPWPFRLPKRASFYARE